MDEARVVIDDAQFAEAVGAGQVLDRPGAVVEAELIRSFCLPARVRDVDPRGIRLRGVTVTGTLDLTAVTLPFGLSFEQCSFDSAPILHGAAVKELVFINCPQLPGLLANGIEVKGDIDLSGSRIVGCHPTSASTSRSAAVWLCESKVGGRLRCIDTVIDPQGERAMQADRMNVGGTVRLLNKFHAMGELRLVGVHVTGSIDMTGARVEAEAGHAVDLGDATIAGNMFIAPAREGRRPEIRGRVNLSSTRIDGKLLIEDTTLTRTPDDEEGRYYSPRFRGQALVAVRLTVGADLAIEGNTEVDGGIDLGSADLGRLVIGRDTIISAPGGRALDLTNADIHSAFVGEGAHIRGSTLLLGAHIRGRLHLDDAVLTDPEKHSLLKADGATIDGDVELKRLRATGGQLKFWRTTIGGGFDATGARVENPEGGTVRLHQSEVRGSVRLVGGFSSIGCVVLSRTQVGGRLDLDGGHFHCPGPDTYGFNPEGAAVRAVSGVFKGGIDLGWGSISPAVNFTDATTTVVQDDPSAWPERIHNAGFSYERFDAPRGSGARGRIWDWRRRLARLHQQPEYDAGPYEQAARVFRQHGYEDGAEELLIRRRTDARRTEAGKPFAAVRDVTGKLRLRAKNLVDWVYDWTVGYGYRPGRVLWLLVVLLALVTATLAVPAVQQTMRATDEGAVFTIDGPLNVDDQATSPDPCGGGRVRCFNPVLYAVDTVVPLIALEQRSTWYPDRFVAGGHAVEWWLNIATVIGWLLSSIFLLSFARLARNT